MKYSITQSGFSPDTGGIAVRSIVAEPLRADAEWAQKQDAAREEYHREHLGELPTETRTLFELFQGYLSSQLLAAYGSHLTGKRILDIGCGLYTSVPPYIGELARVCTYVGLDPMGEGLERNYLFINARIEDVKQTLADEEHFDCFVFCTSLDHIRDLDQAAEQMRSIASPGALAVFFLGLHDGPFVAEMFGRMAYAQLLTDLKLFSFTRRLVRTTFNSLRHFRTLRLRQRQLDAGAALDPYHFHYFTKEKLDETLGCFGQITSLLAVPGTNAVFACCRIA